MSEAQEFRISFENLFRRAEKKIAGPTVDLLRVILKNACLDEGEWVLKDSRRIKKKGRGKFHAIRVESRSGAKSVRVWCKPRGNDSCFEYSLVPPHEISAEEVFKILERANPVSLEVPESPALPGAFLSHVIDVPPHINPPEKVKVFEVSENSFQDVSGEVPMGESQTKGAGHNVIPGIVMAIDSDEVFVALPNGNAGIIKKSDYDLKQHITRHDLAEEGRAIRVSISGSTAKTGQPFRLELDARYLEDGQSSGWTVSDQQILGEICEEFNTPAERIQAWKERAGGVPRGETAERPPEALTEAPEGSFAFSMVLDEPCLLSDQEVMDKALVAMSSAVDESGYIKKNDASNSIIEKLGIRNFVENVSGGTYTSVEGAMRALTMALTNRGHYIQRIHYPSGFNVRGYKLTAKAERRIKALKEKYMAEEGRPTTKLGSVGTTELQDAENKPNASSDELHSEGMTAPEIKAELERFDSNALDRLQSLISECKEAENHIKEVDSVIANLESEISDLKIDLEALDLAEKERVRQMEELTRDIGRIRSKKEPIIKSIEQKVRDREEWEREKAPVLSKKSKVEIEIFGVTGHRRAN